VPKFELAAVHVAAAAGRVTVGGARYRARLLPYVREYVAMLEFTQAVLLELQPEDFINSKQYEDIGYDAYGVAISDELQERFGLEGFVTWYVKFTVDRDEDGDEVIMASLHGAEEPLKRIGGTLRVQFARG
jgi:hypothetical protein